MKHRNLHEAPGKRLARALDAAQGVGVASHTRPTGLQHLGDGDIIWRDPSTQEIYSVRHLPTKIEEGLAAGFATASLRNTVSTSAPASTDGYPDGAWWVQIVSVEDQTVLGVWMYDASLDVWSPQPYDGGMIAPTIDAGLINVAVLAAQLMITKVLRTETDPVTGLYGVFDASGLRVVDEDGPEGDEVDVIRLGPDGEQLLQLGQGDNMVSINSSGGVTARTASVQDLWLDGHQLEARDLLGGPRGIVSQARMFPGKSRPLNGRGAVLGLEGTLRPGRVYKLESSSIVVDTEHGTCDPFAQLHRTIDGTAPQANWGGSAVKESRVGPYSGFRTLPGMIHWIDLTHMDADGPDIPLRAALSLGNYAGNGWVQAAAVVDVIWLVCEDWGPTFPNRGTPFYADGGSTGTPPPARQTQKWTASGMATYQRGGGRDESGGSVQGQYSSWNRETLFVFPDMTATLSGAEIHRITCRSFFDTWYYSSGGTASWCWHGETGIPATSPAKTFMVETAGWPRGAGREINIIPEEFAEWQSGIRRGFIFSTPVTARSHYGRLSSDLNQHWIEVEYSK